MFTKLILRFGLLAVLLAAAAGLWFANDYYANLPQRVSRHETVVLGQNRLVPGTRAALRVVVRDSSDGTPLPGSAITVSLQPSDGRPAIPLYTGLANSHGTAEVAFDVPAGLEGAHTLHIDTASPIGEDHLTQTVTLTRNYRILLSTDKPIYQPGQIIHLRVLALSHFDLKPAAGQVIQIAIADGKGNKVFSKSLTTSDYGVAAADFQLASQVNTGNYKLTATMGAVSSEKSVTVEHYVLPKFKVSLATDRPFYIPGEHVHASLAANYFFGKPVSEGNVIIEGYTFDVERSVTFNLQGATDSAGNFNFEFDLPTFITGSDLDQGLGRYYLEVRVADGTGQTETVNLSFPVSQSQIVINAVPESGIFRAGVENILYVLTSAPDGSPLETELTLTLPHENRTFTAHTDPYGLAEVRFVPTNYWHYFTIQALAANGGAASREFQFQTDSQSGGSILLRPDRPVYRVGDSMALTVLSTQPTGTVYVDIVRERQTVSTRALDVVNGRAEAAVDLTPDLHGQLELHAYLITPTGQIIRDTRMVIVDLAEGLAVRLTPDQDSYHPGEMAGLDIQVTGTDGVSAQSAI
ncbi:MAG TPA: MG2 domain-containing protein, partial [Anaerolineales bacterium]|nr:MG2 domain-containing protein [Anaerolineales bacterium]